MVKIKVKPLHGFDNKPIKFKNPIEYPQPNNQDLPKNFYSALVIGATGTGKTFSVVKLLKYYEQCGYTLKDGTKVEQRVILFSPTIDSNPIFETLKYLDKEDIHTDYSDQLLLEVLDDIKQKRDEADKYQECLRALKKFNRVKSEYELTSQELILLNSIDFDIRNLPKPKYTTPPVNHLILDDLVATDAFKQTGRSAVNNLSVKNRHQFVNLYVLAQTMKGIPKTVRQQTRLVFLYRTNSKKILEDLFELVSMEFTFEEFSSIYDYCTKDVKYNFLTIDNTNKDLILKLNLQAIIDVHDVLPTNREEAKGDFLDKSLPKKTT